MKGMNSFPWCFPKADISLVGKLGNRVEVRMSERNHFAISNAGCPFPSHSLLLLGFYFCSKIPLTFFIPSLLCLGTCPSQPLLLSLFLTIICVCAVFSHVWLCKPTKLLCQWNSPGKTTGAGCLFLHQGIFLTQGLNAHLWVSCIGRWILSHCAIWEVLKCNSWMNSLVCVRSHVMWHLWLLPVDSACGAQAQ